MLKLKKLNRKTAKPQNVKPQKFGDRKKANKSLFLLPGFQDIYKNPYTLQTFAVLRFCSFAVLRFCGFTFCG